MITRLRYPKGYQFFDGNGAPIALGKLYYYQAGSTTAQDTYADNAGAVTNTNPVLLYAAGKLQVDVYLGSAANYKEVLTVSGATVSPWPDDDILRAGQADWGATSGPSQILNKPSLAAVATSGSYSDLSNTPATSAVFTGDSGSGGTSGLVPAPAAGTAVANKFLKADGSWSVPPGDSGSGATNLTVTENATNVAIASSSGSGSTIPSATTSNAGVMTAADRSTLNSLGTAATTNVPASGNAASGQVVLGSDTRLSDARAPVSHASSHAAGGSDAISIAASQVSGIAASLASQDLDNLARVGVGTSDAGNSLSVSGPTVLFANSGDIRATMSKGAAANTAALNFQDSYSTRAQAGLLGNDDFTLSVSSDGSAFNTGLIVNRASGAVSFPNTGGFPGDSGSGGASGLVPAPAAGTAAAGKYLKADGTWSVPPGTAQTNSDWNASSGVAQILNKPALAASATTDTTNASNITSGTLSASRLPVFSSSTNGAVAASGGGTANF